MRASIRLLPFLAILCAGWAVADQAPSLEIEAAEATISVGDRVELRVHARGGGDWMWGELSVEIQPGGAWELVDGPRALSEARPPVWELTVAAMDVGELELPHMSTSIRPRDGEPQQVQAEGGPKINVASVLPPEGDTEPAPIRGPIGVRGFPWEWILPIVLVLLPLLALLVWWWRRRQRVDPDAAIRALPPIEELEAMLNRLSARFGQEPVEGICDGLAGSLRRYLERRCGEPAQEMTSFEMRLLARRLSWPAPVQSGIQRVMETADGVRFGRRQSPESAIRGAVDEVLSVGRALENHLRPKTESEEGVEVAR